MGPPSSARPGRSGQTTGRRPGSPAVAWIPRGAARADVCAVTRSWSRSAASGGPSVITRRGRGRPAVGDRRHTRVVLDEQQAGTGDLADAAEQAGERLRLPLRDAGRRLVEQHHRRRDADLAGGSTIRRLPVESSATNLSRSAPMPIRSINSSTCALSRRSARPSATTAPPVPDRRSGAGGRAPRTRPGAP